ncbi:galactosyldiacylglycerol synthase [Planosporangium thailandense]|uniref:Galactosyldiacylglycerol synthase n=1 Tax=Planosporangium thailandense TaxID=765197 RepID=A0ABX0Y172_9ACTN|nr:glycosyltransferase [Planosporangium thailandense]NJC71180.1 galactosyldiacylglycerol synthase [Planosporangium thailandense]
MGIDLPRDGRTKRRAALTAAKWFSGRSTGKGRRGGREPGTRRPRSEGTVMIDHSVLDLSVRRGDGPPPERVLVVSADIGGGHDATGRALVEQVEQAWPAARLRWVDTLDVVGPRLGEVCRRTYVFNVERTPWLYDFFFASLWRHRWFASASKRLVGAFVGRRLAPLVVGYRPDLILSTFPPGTAGLAWLRRKGRLSAPIGAWVSDFSPHPFWIYPEIDRNFVADPRAVPVALAASPGAPVAACALPVAARFHPGDRAAARGVTGLAHDRLVVLVACGSYGFGAVEEAVRAVLTAGDAVQVVAACGRNEELRRRLAALGEPPRRLLRLGWVDTMPSLLRAADLVVTNAGGATALEAVATRREVVMYRPIAGHGAANAALMTMAGLAETCDSPAQLAALVRSMLPDSDRENSRPR